MKDNRSFHCAFHLYTTPLEVSRAVRVIALEYCHHPPGRPFGNIILKADRDLDRQAVKPACFTRMSARFRIRPLYYPLKGLIMIPAGHRAKFYGLRPPTRGGADATVHGRQKLVKCTGNPGDSHMADFRDFGLAARRLIGFQRWDSTEIANPHGRVHRLFLSVCPGSPGAFVCK